MKSINALASWIKENSTLSESSIYKYSRAVNTISKEMLDMNVIPCDLFMLSELQYEYYLPVILKNEYFINKNRTGNHMYSNALKQYRMFVKSLNNGNASQIEVEQAIGKFQDIDVTERMALVKSRVGQGVFRNKLLMRYNNTCIVTGVSCSRLLIASHIKPWAVSNNEERLSEENGLLLSPTYDRLFYYGLISFTNDGRIIVSSQLSAADSVKLNICYNKEHDLKITPRMKDYLDYHRDIILMQR